jgi:phosphonopyruvate decarboxylase
MIPAATFVEATRALGFSLWTGVPCSYLKPFINYVIDSPDLTYVGAANEGDAVALASGAELGGQKSVVLFQNSGFGNAVNPITSLNMIFEVPVLIITTLRGEPGGAHDEPQHALMGQITAGLFDLMRVPWEYFPNEERDVAAALERATSHMTKTRTPYGLIMKKDSVADHKLKTAPTPRSFSHGFDAGVPASASWGASKDRPSRRDVLSAVQRATRPTDAVVATTGFTGRALYALEDRKNQLYMVGSMGCAGPFGLGLALAQPSRRVIVLDGDGAILMRMGALATLGYERPKNLLHIALDNEVHDSTGAQSTVTHSIDLAAVAAACGYPRVVRARTAAEVEDLVRTGVDELTFVHVKTAPGEKGDLPRPKETPVQVWGRMRSWLVETSP